MQRISWSLATFAWLWAVAGWAHPAEALARVDAYPSAIARVADLSGDEFEGQFGALVGQIQEQQGITASEAWVKVRRDLAAFERERGAVLEASGHVGAAIEVAETLADADLLLSLYLEQANTLIVERRWLATEMAQSAWDLARLLGRPREQVEAGLLVTTLLHRSGNNAATPPYYAMMRRIPRVDLLPIALQEASVSDRATPGRLQQWHEVITLAQAQGKPDIEARAWDESGYLWAREQDWPAALAGFRRADALGRRENRRAHVWQAYSEALEAVGDPDGARSVLAQALAQADVAQSPAAANLYEAQAGLLAAGGEAEAAYAALRRALDLRRVPAPRLTPAVTRMVGITPARATDEAAALAAARNAMREAELAATRSRLLAVAGIGGAALLLAVALGVAYHFKRQAASALMQARDAAELRAEVAHLLALRYQLNPHFLFNAFNQLRERVAANPREAIQLIDHLTAFCRQTLLRPEGGGTVADEVALLTAYLEIEQTRRADGLHLTRFFDPAPHARRLPPFLLLPLVENAIKYGTQTSEETVVVEVRLTAVDDVTMAITVRNSGRWIQPGQAPGRTSTGTGLSNLRRRLASHYPGRHEFQVGPEDDGVVARLTLRGDPQTAGGRVLG